MECRFTEGVRAAVKAESRADNQRFATGYAAVFYDGTPATEYRLWAGAVERIAPTAFDSALATGADVMGLFNHDPGAVLGRTAAKTMALDKDAKGLRYDIKLGSGPTAQNVAEHLDRGDISGSSFSFAMKKEQWEVDEVRNIEVRTILDVELFDVGPVTFPAYGATTAASRDVSGLSEARASYAKWKESAAKEPAGPGIIERKKRAAEILLDSQP